MFYYIYYLRVVDVYSFIRRSSKAQNNRGHTSNTFFISTFWAMFRILRLLDFVFASFHKRLIFYIIVMSINIALCAARFFRSMAGVADIHRGSSIMCNVRQWSTDFIEIVTADGLWWPQIRCINSELWWMMIKIQCLQRRLARPQPIRSVFMRAQLRFSIHRTLPHTIYTNN